VQFSRYRRPILSAQSKSDLPPRRSTDASKTIRFQLPAIILLLQLYCNCDNEVIERRSVRERIVKSSATDGNGERLWFSICGRLGWFFFYAGVCFFQLWKIYKWGVCLQIKGDRFWLFCKQRTGSSVCVCVLCDAHALCIFYMHRTEKQELGHRECNSAILI
jgi:hypothetical protein